MLSDQIYLFDLRLDVERLVDVERNGKTTFF